jgi:hypothetical protein
VSFENFTAKRQAQAGSGVFPVGMEPLKDLEDP